VMGDGGNPADAADFGGTLPSGSVNFAAGETTQVITIDVSGDTDVEPDEGFHLMLSNPSGATLSLAGALGIIRNDDLILSEAVASSVFRLLPSTHLPGETFEVVLAAEPASDINTWTVTEQLPSGAAPDAISHNGNFNSEEGIITWGPFDDVALRTLSYRVVLNMAVGEVGVFGGTASFDGEGVLVGGQNSTEAVSEIGNPRLSDIVFLPRDEIAFTVPVVNGKEYEVQVSSDLMVWVPIETKTASGGSITVIDDSTDKPAIRFYRVVEVGSP